jgi:general secretion pathway protein D
MKGLGLLGSTILLLAAAPAFAEDRAKLCCVPTVELQELITQVGKRTGTQFVVDPRVRGEVLLTGFDVEKVDYSKLLSILNVNQFGTYRQGDYVVILPDVNARQLPTPVYTEANFKADANEYVTLMLTARNACAAHTVPVLRPLMPQAAHLAAEVGSNTLIISDRASNVRRIADMVARLDKASPAGRGCPEWQPAAAPKKGS